MVCSIYNPIQGQGYKPLKVKNSSIFNGYLRFHLYRGLANNNEFLNQRAIPTAYPGEIFCFYFCPIFVSRDFEVGSNDTSDSRKFFLPISMKFGV